MRQLVAALALAAALLLASGSSVCAVDLPLGEPVPVFELPGLDKPFHALVRSPGKRGTVIVFWSNRCPVCRHFEPQLLSLAQEFQPRGLAFIAINSSDTVAHPEESFEQMRRRSRAGNYPFPYVLDTTQQTARAYGVTRTPTVFIVDPERRLLYRGPIDERPKLTEDLGPMQSALTDAARGKKNPQALPIEGTPISFNPALAPPPAAAPLPPGARVPAFSLMATDGSLITLRPPFSADLTVLVFTSQSCPVARSYNDGLVTLAGKYGPRGVYFLFINPNDPAQSPADAFGELKTLAQAKRFPFPYVWDETQVFTRALGVSRTPHVFVLDKQGRVRYQGPIDDHPDADRVRRPYLTGALDALLAGKEPEPKSTPAFGTEIKWKPSPRD